MSVPSSWQDLVAIGEVARAQGRRGEVAVNPLTDFPDRFDRLERVFIEGEDGRAVALRLEWVRRQGRRPVLKFEAVSGIGDAEKLAGREIRVPVAELVALPEDSVFHFQLAGCRVFEAGDGYVGEVEDILVTGGTDVLVVRSPSREERLIPLCRQICRHIDTEEKRIEIRAPEGLLTLNED